MIRTKLGLAVAAGVAVISVPLAAGTATAADLDCADIGHPVIVDDVDPDNLDADGDGTGCESQPGEPAALPSELADTGVTDVIHRHPLRAYGAASLLVLGGAATVIVVRRRTRTEEN